jgi:hypothetical protein
MSEPKIIPGDVHIIPLAPCPLCGAPANFLKFEEDMCWMAECSGCKLTLGMPYGYASRLDLCDDWNRTPQLTESSPDPTVRVDEANQG